MQLLGAYRLLHFAISVSIISILQHGGNRFHCYSWNGVKGIKRKTSVYRKDSHHIFIQFNGKLRSSQQKEGVP